MATQIGAELCRQEIDSKLLPAQTRELSEEEVEGLWRIFVAIGEAWENTVHDSAGLKSSWLEFVTQKSVHEPSYVEEYVNALAVIKELEQCHVRDAFEKLFFCNGIPGDVLDSNGVPGPALDTRLAHAKHFVVDEFIRVQIIAGGFKNFIRPQTQSIRPENIVNYNGFIAGSRYNRIKPVRPYEDSGQ
jgi:hypothetical protein